MYTDNYDFEMLSLNSTATIHSVCTVTMFHKTMRLNWALSQENPILRHPNNKDTGQHAHSSDQRIYF